MAVAARVLSSAVPSEPPICCVVLTSALATPASRSLDPDEGGAAEGREGQAQADTHQDLLRRDVHPEIALHPDLRQPGQTRRRRSARPTVIGIRGPIRGTRPDDAPAARMMPNAKGRKASPALSAE